jgi:hypothetical protein
VVIHRGERKETIHLGTELEKSRVALRSFDGDFQKRLLQVAKAKRTVYFTQGHGERTRTPAGPSSRTTVDAVYRTVAAPSPERTRPRSTARRRTPRGTWPRTSSPPVSRTAA